MYTLLLTLRIIHIVCGVFWAGTIFFMTFYILPAVERSGPDGGKIMQSITSTNKFAVVVPVMALLTILSGLMLIWKASGGFTPFWFTTNYGLTLTIGGAFAIIAFIHGMVVNKPRVTRMEKIAKELALRGGPPTEQERNEMMSIRVTVFRTTRWLACWLGITVVAMAVARYI